MRGKEKSLRICHLYADLLNLYGDRGNILTLEKRCIWRGIEVFTDRVGIKEEFNPERYDIVFIGGGQDFDQETILEDFVVTKGKHIIEAVANDVVFLCVCGGYQMMGKYYRNSKGVKTQCLDAVPVRTEAGSKRLIGNIECYSTLDLGKDCDRVLVGFENHSGRTYLEEGVKPLAKVLKGFGNNGEDFTEGARYKNVYCTYMHGSFLPKNPLFADKMIEVAINRKYKEIVHLEQINDEFENNARKKVKTCKNRLTFKC